MKKQKEKETKDEIEKLIDRNIKAGLMVKL
jgi:hypothetical protein